MVAWIAEERAVELDRPGFYWIVGRTYYDTRKEYDYLVDFFARLGCLQHAHGGRSDRRRTIVLDDGTTFQTISVDQTMTIGGDHPDGILACEAGQISHEAFQRLRSRAAAGHGWLILSGTFENAYAWYRKVWLDWHGSRDGDHVAFNLPSWTNKHIYPEGRYDPEIVALEEEVSQDFFMERIAGIPRRPQGLVFGPDFDSEIHVRDVEYMPGVPVDLAIDPGYNQSAHALLAIQRPRRGPIQVFDEIYDTKYSTEAIIEEAQSREWWADVQPGLHAIDIQGTIRQQSVTPPAEVWLHRTSLSFRSRKVGIQDGIDRLKGFLKLDGPALEPRIVMAPHCHGILSELGMIESPLSGKMDAYRYNIKKDGLVHGQNPINRANHSIKALIYWLICTYGYTKVESNKATVRSWR